MILGGLYKIYRQCFLSFTVYDFDDAEDGGIIDSDTEDDKSKIVKILPRKSQSVSQAHMCNYCNYTSPKRYLLSRHMKSHSEERPHKCSVCERGFKTMASLQNHVNTHTGTKPHGCKFCDAAFTTSGIITSYSYIFHHGSKKITSYFLLNPSLQINWQRIFVKVQLSYFLEDKENCQPLLPLL